MRAYHFVAETLRDGCAIPADGEWLVHEGELALCASGLHASLHPFDALAYAPGNTLCLVELDGEILTGDDKVVATRRRIVKRIDAGPLMREFARWCALQVIELWDAPQAVRDYLTTGDESLRDAARAAAGVAAGVAAGAAGAASWDAWVAAGDAWAARAAARAARDAAEAARAAAGDARDAAEAARVAARAASWDARIVAGRAAAWAAWAAGVAAGVAAGASQKERFAKMVDAAIGSAK